MHPAKIFRFFSFSSRVLLLFFFAHPKSAFFFGDFLKCLRPPMNGEVFALSTFLFENLLLSTTQPTLWELFFHNTHTESHTHPKKSDFKTHTSFVPLPALFLFSSPKKKCSFFSSRLQKKDKFGI